MSNEAFDKKIKAKLEQINPPYEDKAWERFAPLLPTPSGGLLPPWGQIMALAGAIATIVYLSYDNFKKEGLNQALKQELSSSKAIQMPLPKTIFEKDTIYITKYIDRIIDKTNTKSIIELKKSELKFEKLEEVYKQIIIQKNAEIADSKTFLKNNSITLEKTKGIYTKMADAPSEIEGVKTGMGKTDKSEIEEKATQPEAIYNKAKAEDERVILPEIVKNRPEKEDAKKKIVRASVGLSALNFNRTKGFGITSHYKIWNNWGLNLGVDALIGRPTFFSDEKEYKRKYNRPFEDNLGALGPKDGGAYRNIRGIRQLISLPVSVQYTYGLPHNFAIYANAGTALQLYSKDRFRFDLSQKLGQFDPVDFNKKLESRLFGNLTAAIGLQKEWNRFVLQASPNYVFSLKEQRLLEPSMFGLRINAMYRLYK